GPDGAPGVAGNEFLEIFGEGVSAGVRAIYVRIGKNFTTNDHPGVVDLRDGLVIGRYFDPLTRKKRPQDVRGAFWVFGWSLVGDIIQDSCLAILDGGSYCSSVVGR